MSETIITTDKYIQLLLAAYGLYIAECINKRQSPLGAIDWYKLHKDKSIEEINQLFS